MKCSVKQATVAAAAATEGRDWGLGLGSDRVGRVREEDEQPESSQHYFTRHHAKTEENTARHTHMVVGDAG